MDKLKELLKAYFAPYEHSGLVHGGPACTTDELAEGIVEAVFDVARERRYQDENAKAKQPDAK